MSIKLTNPNIAPALSYDRIHIDSFTIVQKKNDNIANVKRDISVTATVYSAEADGTTHYDGNNLITANTNDFDTIAISEYLVNNNGSTITDAIAAYDAVKAAVQAEYDAGNLDTFKLMAYFEMAIGHTLKLLNNTDISGIE